jgi:hypothetical protein
MSSMYIADRSVMALQNCFPGSAAVETGVRTALEQLQSVPRPIERSNFPLIVGTLLDVVASHSESDLAAQALTEVFSILDRLHMTFPDSSSAHHPFLLSFSSCMFTPAEALQQELPWALVKVWLRVMSSGTVLEKMQLSRSWVLLDLLSKSLLATKRPLDALDAADERCVNAGPLAAVAVTPPPVTPPSGRGHSPTQQQQGTGAELQDSPTAEQAGFFDSDEPRKTTPPIRWLALFYNLGSNTLTAPRTFHRLTLLARACMCVCVCVCVRVDSHTHTRCKPSIASHRTDTSLPVDIANRCRGYCLTPLLPLSVDGDALVGSRKSSDAADAHRARKLSVCDADAPSSPRCVLFGSSKPR